MSGWRGGKVSVCARFEGGARVRGGRRDRRVRKFRTREKNKARGKFTHLREQKGPTAKKPRRL